MTPLEQLTLFWLLARPTNKGSVVELRGGLQPLLKHIDGWKKPVERALDALDRGELVGLTRDSLRLKPGGKVQALKLLGLTSPPETTWAGLKIGILVPNLLELPRPGNLRMTADDLSAAVIRRWLDGAAELAPRADRSPPQAARRPEAAPSRASAATPPDDLAAFAQRVLAAARATPKAGWFGDNKVFISHVWRQLREPGRNLEAFKERLVSAHRDSLLNLSRADLVEAMHPKDVADSETRWMGERWHFIRLDDGPPVVRARTAEPAARPRVEPAPSGTSAARTTEDPAAFARRVFAAARASKTGHFGRDKVFISHVYRQLGEPGDVEAFKQRLVEAHRLGLLSLTRADLVEAMDPKDVDESETRYLSATFHFIRLPGESPW